MRRASFVFTTAFAALTFAPAGFADPAPPSPTAPAAAAPSPTDARADPAEKVNRVGYGIHQFFDKILLRPAALTYKAVTPKPLRTGIENVLTNLSEPVVAVNDVLQGRFRKAGGTGVRFVTNSTVGVLGLFDVAKHAGLAHHDNGFALTLGRAGVHPGPYLFVPLVGPTTVRDAIGSGVDVLTDPFHYLARRASSTVIVSKTVVSGLDARANADGQLTALMSDATDPYATLRSVYLQNQQSRVDDTPGAAVPALPDFDDDKATPPPPSSPPAKPAG